ncbi:MAG: hypothetical protein H7Y15_18525 [Pseudonocardia sp.]|nr:hypothetical protein [Pseudonocardia sp.]
MTNTAHDLVGQIVDGSILNEAQCPPGTTVVRVPRPDNGIPFDTPTWRGLTHWHNPTSSGPMIERDGRFLVLYVPLVEIGDEITDAAQLDHLPLGTVLIGRGGDTAQNWMRPGADGGAEVIFWSITAYSLNASAAEVHSVLARPVTVLHLPRGT